MDREIEQSISLDVVAFSNRQLQGDDYEPPTKLAALELETDDIINNVDVVQELDNIVDVTKLKLKPLSERQPLVKAPIAYKLDYQEHLKKYFESDVFRKHIEGDTDEYLVYMYSMIMFEYLELYERDSKIEMIENMLSYMLKVGNEAPKKVEATFKLLRDLGKTSSKTVSRNKLMERMKQFRPVSTKQEESDEAVATGRTGHISSHQAQQNILNDRESFMMYHCGSDLRKRTRKYDNLWNLISFYSNLTEFLNSFDTLRSCVIDSVSITKLTTVNESPEALSLNFKKPILVALVQIQAKSIDKLEMLNGAPSETEYLRKLINHSFEGLSEDNGLNTHNSWYISRLKEMSIYNAYDGAKNNLSNDVLDKKHSYIFVNQIAITQADSKHHKHSLRSFPCRLGENVNVINFYDSDTEEDRVLDG